jgi:hypothetical protein
MQIDLVAEKTAAEQQAEAMRTGHGFITPTFHIMSGTLGARDSETFDISYSGLTLYFKFNEGVRRVNMDLTPVLREAYRLAMEE